MEKICKGGIPLKDDRRISILEKLFLYRLPIVKNSLITLLKAKNIFFEKILCIVYHL